MGEPWQTPEAIARWAEKQAPPADSPTYKRMTTAERLLVVKLHDDGLTQVEIAQRLGRSQSTISDTLAEFADTTELAKRYFDANALSMAENVVRNGTARDHNVALAGRGVLRGQDAGSIKIAVGVSLHGLPSQSEGAQKHSVIDAGSDK